MSKVPGRRVGVAYLVRMRERLHPGVAPLLVAAAVVAAAAVVHVVDPHEPGNFPSCPWLALTGTYCPGCGTMRAVATLSHLDLAGALQMNLLLLAVAPFAVAAWASWLLRAWRPSWRTSPRPPPAWMIWTLLSGIVGFWILRNLPALSLLAPGGVPAPAFT